MSTRTFSQARVQGRRAFRMAARALAVLLLSVTPVLLVAVPAGAQTPPAGGAVTATPDGSPLGTASGKIQKIINLADQAALWASLLSILIGAGAWGLSKHFGNYGGAHKGQILVLGGAAGALLASMGPAIVNGLFGA